MIHRLYKLLLTTAILLSSPAVAHADVAREGYYFALMIVLAILLLPVIIMALSRRTRKKLYLGAFILWTAAALTYTLATNARQNEFLLISSVSYIFLMVYLIKEKKLDRK